MDDLAHNVWATPHDIALQQMEYTRRQDALAREAARQNQAHDSDTTRQAESQTSKDSTTLLHRWMVLAMDSPRPTPPAAGSDRTQVDAAASALR